MKKIFDRSPEAAAALRNEVRVRELLGQQPWVVPIVEAGERHLVMPLLREEARLDRIAPSLPIEERRTIASASIAVAFEIFFRNFAHRDYHAKNLFLVDGSLLVTDFEMAAQYGAGQRPPFPESYDLVGRGMDSPARTGHACYASSHPSSLQSVLGVSLTDALEGYATMLKEQLRVASLTFQTSSARHTCRARRVYGSIALPYFTVPAEDAQRDTAKRFAQFGIDASIMSNRSVLDLGSNIGAILFEAALLRPTRALGIEYDDAKVEIARRVAAYNGLNQVEFRAGDIDRLEVSDVDGPADVVFCLAVDAHVKDRQRLYRFLGQCTGDVLFFEGNSGSDVAHIKASLEVAGFGLVEDLGVSGDDCLAANNRRPLIRARKRGR